MTNASNNKPQETPLQRRLRRLNNSIRKRLPWVDQSARVSSLEALRNKFRLRTTGCVRCHGNLFDLQQPRMTDEFKTALMKGTYEWREIDMIDRFVREDDRVAELGVCIGATSMFLHDRVGKDNLVIFDADPRNLEMALHNFKLNEKDIHCVNAILWSGTDRPETVSFSSNENPASSSLLDREGSEVSFEIETKDLETVLQEHKATVIVLDIEGGEIDLFNNAGDLPGVRLIIMEAHERVVGKEANEDMLDRLKARGFEIAENRMNKYIVLSRP